jgi:hypothetical protein
MAVAESEGNFTPRRELSALFFASLRLCENNVFRLLRRHGMRKSLGWEFLVVPKGQSCLAKTPSLKEERWSFPAAWRENVLQRVSGESVTAST